MTIRLVRRIHEFRDSENPQAFNGDKVSQMSEMDNIVLEHLSAIRGDLQLVRDDLRELKTRIGHLEEQTASLFGLFASLSNRMDRYDQRVERIERGLELTA